MWGDIRCDRQTIFTLGGDDGQEGRTGITQPEYVLGHVWKIVSWIVLYNINNKEIHPSIVLQLRHYLCHELCHNRKLFRDNLFIGFCTECVEMLPSHIYSRNVERRQDRKLLMTVSSPWVVLLRKINGVLESSSY